MNGIDASASIGIFDSGVGGLTVCRKIAEALPGESLVYLGDTARVPYGSKSAATVERYARACAALLMERNVKMLVVACNTASAFALPLLQASLEIPVVGVVEPGARAACSRTRTGRVGVIGTRGTINSGSYEKIILRMCPDYRVFSMACPLFVPFAEEGWTEGAAITEVTRAYLGELLPHAIDTLVLGCTHYPLLSAVISEVAGDAVALVDSAEETARVVAATLRDRQLINPSDEAGQHAFLVSDAPECFRDAGERFFGYPLERVEWVDVRGV